MNGNGPVSNGLAELNHHMRDDHKQIRDGVTGEGQGLSEEDESRINEDGEDVNNGWVDAVQAQAHTMAALQRQQSQPERPLVCWERFLPLRSLKVLLVESDDSTRRVVCALLRNCGYEGQHLSWYRIILYLSFKNCNLSGFALNVKVDKK